MALKKIENCTNIVKRRDALRKHIVLIIKGAPLGIKLKHINMIKGVTILRFIKIDIYLFGSCEYFRKANSSNINQLQLM